MSVLFCENFHEFHPLNSYIDYIKPKLSILTLVPKQKHFNSSDKPTKVVKFFKYAILLRQKNGCKKEILNP